MLRPFAGCTVKLDAHEVLTARTNSSWRAQGQFVYNNRQAVLLQCKNYTPTPQLADMHRLCHSCVVAMCMLTGDC